MNIYIVCGLLLAGLSASASSIAVPESYTVKELGAGQYVIGIDDRGQVLTWGSDDSAPTYLYEEDGNARDLSALPMLPTTCKYSPSVGPLYVAAAALSHRGVVLMNVYGPQSSVSLGNDCVTLYRDGLLFHDRTLDPAAYALGINDRDQIIGLRTDADNEVVGFGPRCDFDPSGSTITPDAINDREQIVGTSPNGVEVCTNGTWRMLPPFPAAVNLTSASAINNRGDVTGTAFVSVSPTNMASHGFLYRNGTTVDIGSVDGVANDNTYPEDINDRGQIVGATYTEAGGTAFLYQDGKMYDLMKLIRSDDPLQGLVKLLGGARINNRGVIAVNGEDLRTGTVHVYVLTPHRND